MSEERIKAWVTKYALTTGIQFVSGEVSKGFPDMLCYGRNEYGQLVAAHGKNWHRTHEAAVARAEQMRKVKIASLKKSIAKMEALRFDVQTE